MQVKKKWLVALGCLFLFGFSSQQVQGVEANQATDNPQVSYRTHVENLGWQQYVNDGKTSGTTGQAKRLEGVQLRVDPGNYVGNITYRTHIQDYGWEKDFVSDGQVSGTTGQAKRLEAIQIKLTGQLAQHYDVYYRVHAENFGWLDWAKNGGSAGTAGFAYRLEGLQVQIIPKNKPAPGREGQGFIQYQQPNIRYQTHVETLGWQNWQQNGHYAGTTGKRLRLEAVKSSLSNLPANVTGGVSYRTHIQDYGWEKNWQADGSMSGTSGQGKRLEAIQLKLTGNALRHYDVYYRVHAQNFGWLGWAKNGESAGTAGFGYRLEAVQMKVVRKNSPAPGSTKGAFKQYVKPVNPNLTSQVHFINVGQGDATLIQTGRENILIDGGTRRSGNIILAYLRQIGVHSLQAVVATHPDADHIGGLTPVINQMPVGQVYAPRVSHTTNTYKQFLQAVKGKGLGIKEARNGVTIPSAAPGVSLKFVGPVRSYSQSQLNDWSGVLLYQTQQKKMLFTGDAEARAERDMLQAGVLSPVDVLKVSHHGSSGASTTAFLQTIRPKYAVISVGRNSYGHPTSQVLNRLSQVGASVYRTDQMGNIVVTVQANQLTIR